MDIFSVSDVTRYIKNLMQDDRLLRGVYIRGEVSNFKLHYSGHCYFTLKDTSASIKAVMFKSKAAMLKFLPENGMKVVAFGAITVFERDGQYQLYVNALLPEGAGELSVAFAQLKEKLAAEGLFDHMRKKALPKFPQTIGIVTSATGAVLHDIYTVSKRRNPNVGLRLYPVQVQGAEAAGQIAAAIAFFNQHYPVDVLIVGRGGGSMEDLWPFNEEIVVRAIGESRIPVVAAVGHETDFTLADFVSDVRAATPSQAAELAVPDVADAMRYLHSLFSRLEARRRLILREKSNRLSVCIKNRAFQHPTLVLSEKKQTVDYLWEKINRQKKMLLTKKQHNLIVLMEKLEMLNPMKVIKRGYGIVKSEEKIINSVRQVAVGDKIEVVLAEGAIEAVVTAARKERMGDGAFGEERRKF